MKRKYIFICMAMCVSSVFGGYAQETPLQLVCKVADKVCRDVRFYYNLKLSNNKDYGKVQTLDFSRNYAGDGCVYALSTLLADKDTTVQLSVVNYGDCKILINEAEVWKSPGMQPDAFQYIERDFILKEQLTLPLKKGVNKILIKSKSPDIGGWKIYLKPEGFQFTLKGLKEIELSLNEVAQWLMMGTFPASSFHKREIVENEFVTGKMYRTGDGKEVTWQLPRLELAAANAEIHQPWGEGYTAFNYHAGGLAMAMEELGQYTGNKKYSDYCRTYCDFYIEKHKYMAYQKYALNMFNAWDHKLVEGYLLDYTSAPLLPFAEVLLSMKAGKRNTEYRNLFNEMKEYLIHTQTRTPEGNFCRINPKKYAVWVDDMYMGLPFLVQASRLTTEAKEREKLLDDAVNQVWAFNKYVYHPDKHLYQHGQFTEEAVVQPFWSRGNGWALWAVTKLLTYLPENHPRYKRLLTHYRNHVKALISCQDETGLWHNILDNPASYLETSGTAIFTCCIAKGIQNGWLNAARYKPIVWKAWKGIETQIGNEYEVHGITVGTNCTTDISYYLERPTCINDCHGLFPVILAGIEVDRLFFHQKKK